MGETQVQIPQPSITNYPDGQALSNLDSVAFDTRGIRYKVPEGGEATSREFDYLQVWINHTEPIPTTLTPIVWGSNIMKMGSGKLVKIHNEDTTQKTFTQIQLMPGYIYHCSADLGVESISPDTSGSVGLDYGWFSVSQDAWIQSAYGSLRNNTANQQQTKIAAIPLIAYIEVKEEDAPFVMEMRVVSSSSSNEVLKENSHFNIEVKAKL